MPSTAVSRIAGAGAPVLASTRAITAGNRPSSARAKKMRGAVIIEPFNVPKVLIATAADTATTPAGAKKSCAQESAPRSGALHPPHRNRCQENEVSPED